MATAPVSAPQPGVNVAAPRQQVASQSQQINPTVTPSRNSNPNATWVVYAIHGLNSDNNTWVAKNGFSWLESLSQYLETHHGQACDIEYVGWNTTPLGSVTNIASGIDAARQLAEEIFKRWDGTFGFTQLKAVLNSRPPPRKVIFIGHSMGGILARAILGFMNENDPVRYKPFLDSVQGVCLLASPSAGSNVALGGAPLLSIVKGIVALVLHLPATAELATNSAHIDSLKPNSQDLQAIEKSFNAFCTAYETANRTKLKVSALRETAGQIGPVQIVSQQSADIPASTLPLVDGVREDLVGLNHTQVTNYTSMTDPNLLKILQQFLRFQGVLAAAANAPATSFPPNAGIGPEIPPQGIAGHLPASSIGITPRIGLAGAPQAPASTAQPAFPRPEQTRVSQARTGAAQ